MKQEEHYNIPLPFSFKTEDISKHPNILIAAGFWDKDRYDAAKICYKFMRNIDDLIDDHKARNVRFQDCEKKAYENQVLDQIACLNGKNIQDPFIEEVVETIKRYHIPVHLFHSFAKSMIYDIYNEGFPTYSSFLEYAEGASVAPASIFVHLCCLDENHTDYVLPDMDLLATARPCAIFSYIVHIIRDFETDYKENLIYLSKDLLDKFELDEKDLYNVAYNIDVCDAFRNLVKEYTAYANTYRIETAAEITKLSAHLKPKYLHSLQIIFQLYLMVFQTIKNEPASFSRSKLTPTNNEILDHVRKYKALQNVQ